MSPPPFSLTHFSLRQAAREALSSRHRQVLVAVGGLLGQAGCYRGVHVDESRHAMSTVRDGFGVGVWL